MINNSPYDEKKALTVERMQNLQVGDVFQEMYSWWIQVIARDGFVITYIDSSKPEPITCSLWEFLIKITYKHTGQPYVLYDGNYAVPEPQPTQPKPTPKPREKTKPW